MTLRPRGGRHETRRCAGRSRAGPQCHRTMNEPSCRSRFVSPRGDRRARKPWAKPDHRTRPVECSACRRRAPPFHLPAYPRSPPLVATRLATAHAASRARQCSLWRQHMNRPRWDRLRPRHILAVALAWQLGHSPPRRAARAQQTGQTGTISGKVVDEHGAGGERRAGLPRHAGHRHYRPHPAGPTRSRRCRPERRRSTCACWASGPTRRASPSPPTSRHPGLHASPRPAAAADHGRDRHPDAAHEPRRQRRRHHLTPTDIQRAAPRSTTEMLRYVPGLHPGRELGRRGQREHLDARHPGRRVRDVHGGRACRCFPPCTPSS